MQLLSGGRAIQRLIFLFLTVLATGMAPRLAVAEDVEVDVELVLAVDVSRSMTPRELEIQRRGYAEAIVSDEVVNAIREGLVGRIAVTYVEWAGSWSQNIVVGWTLIGIVTTRRPSRRN